MTEHFKKTRLGNGLRIVSEKMDGVRSVSIGVWIASGSRHESKAQNGISHLVEHMLFKGTRSLTAYAIAVSLERFGGHLNAFTEREFTCVYAVVLDENLADAVKVIADVVQHPLFQPRDLENEKRIIAEEIKNVDDNPEDALQEIFLNTVFPDHPLGRSTLGSFSSIGSMQTSDLTSYHKRHYTCGNLIVSAAGNLEHETLVRLADKHMRDLPLGRPRAGIPARFGRDERKRVARPTTQTHLVTGVPSYGYLDKKKFPLIVLDTYLGGGMSSRLFQNVREKQGLAYSVYSFIDFWSDAGLWGVYTGTSPERMEKAEKSIHRELAAVVARRIPESALRRIQSQITRNLVLTLEDPSSRMNRLAKMEAYSGRYTTLTEVVAAIQGVSSRDVHRVAQELLEGRKRYTVLMEPAPN
jgi:predicted Zn-dependent peptidase